MIKLVMIKIMKKNSLIISVKSYHLKDVIVDIDKTPLLQIIYSG